MSRIPQIMRSSLDHLKRACPRVIKRPINVILGRELPNQVDVRVPTAYLGSSYGGMTICPVGLNAGSVVYSFGIGQDISFDLEIIKRYGAQVIAFDPTPKSLKWLERQELPREFSYHGYGLAAYDGSATFYPPGDLDAVSHSLEYKHNATEPAITVPVHRFCSILCQLGHQRVDVVKLDIEGAEFAVIDDILTADFDIGQLLVEFHHRFEPGGVRRTRRCRDKLRDRGYQIFSISPNGRAYSFIARHRGMQSY